MLSWLVNNSLVTALVLTFGGMLLLMVLESLRDSEGLADTGRLFSNWCLGLMNFFLALLLTALVLLPLLDTFKTPFQLRELHPVVEFFVIVLVFEAMAYWLHRFYHRMNWLWRLHAIHHMDTRLDVTTSHRHHMGEVVINTALIVPAAILLGVSPEAWLLFNLVRIMIVLWSHSQLHLSPRVDGVIRLFVVTPSFHRNHHLSNQAMTDSNYGTMVPWFDYMLGTATRPALIYPVGLEQLRDPASSRLDRLLLLPFRWNQSHTGTKSTFRQESDIKSR